MREERAGDLAAALRRVCAGDVRFDPVSRVLYSTDASNYQIEPLGVVHPRDADDVAAAVATCASFGVAVVPRGGGSGLAGQAIGEGVVLDCSVHLHDIVVDPERRTARVGAGAVLDRVNRAAARHGLTFGPDPASAERACLGGVVGNNATGAHSILYGMTADHLLSADVVLADGSVARLERRDRNRLRAQQDHGTTEARAYATLMRLADEGTAVVRRDFPRYWRRSGGYNLDRLVQTAADGGPIDAAAVFAGSEGSLAVATSFEIGLVPLPAATCVLVAQFDDPLEPFRAVPCLLESGAAAIELIDSTLMALARQAPGYADDIRLVRGHPEALLAVEYRGETATEARSAAEGGIRALRRACPTVSTILAETPDEQARVWRVRKAGLGLLMRMRGDWKPACGIEDTAVPPEHLADYMAAVRGLMAAHGVRAAYYAHASAGCIHVRPILNLKSQEGVGTLASLSEEMFRLVERHGGVNSGEHGDGLARGCYNLRHFGADVYAMFEQVKAAFDPDGIMNPGKVVASPPMTAHLRYGPSYRPIALIGRFRYPDDGDLERAIEQCNGAGVCRKLDVGAMCPSFQVTLDEAHSTRARANALRAVLDGRLPSDALVSAAIADVFDLCVSCKACKAECPSGVDIARLKIEVLAARNEREGAPIAGRLMAHIHDLDRWGAPFAPLINLATAGPMWNAGAKLLGLSPQRSFPHLHRDTFDRWWARREPRATSPDTLGAPAPGAGERPGVVLFADTFATYHEPSIGRAAVAVLEAAGFHVIVPPRACCGRPALSQGMIDVAVRGMEANVATLAPLARAGLSIVVPEPSCASTFRDEMPDLLARNGDQDDVGVVAAAVRTLDEFVADLAPGALQLLPGPTSALLHVHCHQRAHTGVMPSVTALAHVPGLKVEEPDAGCCGMAGAFGYGAAHYDVSIAMAERKLAPAVRALRGGAVVVASGTSCRQQIFDTTGRRAVHPIELLAAQLAPEQLTTHPGTAGTAASTRDDSVL